VLASSAGFADLEQYSLLSLGSVTLHQSQPFDVAQLMAVYGTSFSTQGTALVAEIHEQALQLALGTEAEAALDRFVRQVATYEELANVASDPLWTAVTGYYAAFFAANALLLACGRGFVRVDTSQIAIAQQGGLHSVRLTPGSTFGQLELRLTAMGTGGSHHATWKTVRGVLDDCAATVGNGTREAQVFASLAALIVGPRWLSDERNDINYAFRRNPFLAALWTRELSHLVDHDALEGRLLAAMAPRPEQRFELVMVGCASLLRGLFRRFLTRGGKIDPHRTKRRASAMAACPQLAWLVDF
jgi:hypothetical protein